jgi:hypothetical protein
LIDGKRSMESFGKCERSKRRKVVRLAKFSEIK